MSIATATAPAAEPSSAFTHTYRPACVSQGEYAYQRRFGNSEFGHHPDPVIAATDPQKGRFTVFRDGETDLAEVRLAMGLHSNAFIDLRMTPAELREAAARLLDAAHDIETNPADVLRRHTREGGAA